VAKIQEVPKRQQMKIWSMSFTCRIPEATNAHSEYVILTAFPLQQWLHERASMLRYRYIACLVKTTVKVRSHGVIYTKNLQPYKLFVLLSGAHLSFMLYAWCSVQYYWYPKQDIEIFPQHVTYKLKWKTIT
jgi:hypothetical protein